MSTFGNRLKKIRKELRLSQEAFGERLGLTRASIASVEADNSNFSQEILCKMIPTFNINLNYLLGGIGQPFLPQPFGEVQDELTQKVEEILKQKGII